MATELLRRKDAPGKTIYYAIWNDQNQVFDFSDNTFKSLAAATTPYVVATEQTGGKGGQSYYDATIDLNQIHKAGSRLQASIEAYEQVGSSPNLATDTPLGTEPLDIVFGRSVLAGRGRVDVGLNVTIDGNDCWFQVWLTCDGELVDLHAADANARCDIQVREQTAGANLFQIDDQDDPSFALSANREDYFELRKQQAGFTADKNYIVTVTVTENGNTHVRHFPLSTFGGGN
ncbi:MAG: hypothetical protein GXP27_14310 [Planctomycetes bacterium]|nr:hypothetical protein [Planctomycetota bacterium]